MKTKRSVNNDLYPSDTSKNIKVSILIVFYLTMLFSIVIKSFDYINSMEYEKTLESQVVNVQFSVFIAVIAVVALTTLYFLFQILRGSIDYVIGDFFEEVWNSSFYKNIVVYPLLALSTSIVIVSFFSTILDPVFLGCGFIILSIVFLMLIYKVAYR